MEERALVSFAEYMNMDDPNERLALHHGVPVMRPVHTLPECSFKNELVRVLDGAMNGRNTYDYLISMSIAYKPFPEWELWVAGIAIVSNEQQKTAKVEENCGYIGGSPEVVVETLGPAMPRAEALDERDLALRAGSLQFWIIDPKERLIEVMEPNRNVTICGERDSLPLPPPWTGSVVCVDDIFKCNGFDEIPLVGPIEDQMVSPKKGKTLISHL